MHKIKKIFIICYMAITLEVTALLEFLSYIFINCLYLILYISNGSSFPHPLNEEQEKEYFIKFKSGDKDAKNVLIEHNLRLVAHIIKKYYTSSVEQEDLISIGTVGLIKAINTFDPYKGASLSTYAARCIENEILMYFRNQKKLNSEIFLNDPIDSDKEGNNLSMLNILCSEDNIDEIVDQKITVQKLYKYIDGALSEREKTIVKMRFGLYGSKSYTQKEVAERMGISRSYVSRIEKKAVTKLQREFYKGL